MRLEEGERRHTQNLKKRVANILPRSKKMKTKLFDQYISIILGTTQGK